MRKTRPAVLLLLLLLLSACDRQTVIHRYQPVPSEGWQRSDTLTFTIPPIPHSGTYTVNLGLRYTSTFPYQDVWLVTETRLRSPHALRRDTLCFLLADSAGTPTGSGLHILQREALLTSLPLVRGQQGRVLVRHIMARETLPFITDVGVKIVED